MRRIRRLLATGLCAGAAMIGGAASVSAQQGAPGVTPVGYNAALRGYAGHGNYCPPPCAAYAYPCAPSHAPAYPHGHPSDMAPRTDGSDMAPAPDGGAAPSTTPAPTPSFSSLSGATGTPSAPLSATPNAVGDFFGIAQPYYLQTLGFGNWLIPDPSASVVGRIKATENNSPIPQDRFFLDYAYYDDVPFLATGVGVSRFVPGVERTFLDGLMSVEVRMPFAQTLDNTLVLGSPVDGDAWEFGNVYTAVKTLLYEGDSFALAAGLGISTPTANDLSVVVPGGPAGVVENQAVHLLPYFGMLYVPNETFFSQAYIQVDVDVNGNPIVVDGDQVGVFQGQTLMYFSGVLGAWLYDNPCSNTLTGVAGVTEVHYTTAVSDADTLTIPGVAVIGGGSNDLDFVTGMLGVHLFYAGGTRVTFGYGVPLASDRFADGELRMMVNFGAPFGLLGTR